MKFSLLFIVDFVKYNAMPILPDSFVVCVMFHKPNFHLLLHLYAITLYCHLVEILNTEYEEVGCKVFISNRRSVQPHLNTNQISYRSYKYLTSIQTHRKSKGTLIFTFGLLEKIKSRWFAICLFCFYKELQWKLCLVAYNHVCPLNNLLGPK